MSKVIGVIGVGHLMSYIVRGWMRADPSLEIVLGPRNREIVRELSDAFGLDIAANNATVVKRSDIVVLATRPADLLAAATDLPWRPGQIAVSVAAGVSHSGLQRVCEPATVVRTMPVTASEIGESPTTMYPDNDDVRDLFERVGSVHAFKDEAVFDLANAHGVVFSVFHAGIQTVAAWFEDNGLPAGQARELAAAAFKATGEMVLAHPERGFDEMVAEYATEGSLTRIALEALRANGGLDGWRDALDKVQARCREINAETR